MGDGVVSTSSPDLGECCARTEASHSLLGGMILLITGFSLEQETEAGDLAHYVQKSIPVETESWTQRTDNSCQSGLGTR